MTKHKIKTVSIIIGSIIAIDLAIAIVSGVIATKIINERKFASQPTISPTISTQVAEFFSEDNPAFLTAVAALPPTTPSSELVEKVHARYILTSDKTTANDVLGKLKSGANWSEMCTQYSLDKVTAQNDCDLGWFPHDVMVKELEILAFNTPVDEFGGPEHTVYGWVIIQVLGHEIRPYTEDSH